MKTFFCFQGTTYEGKWDQWYGPSGREKTYAYNMSAVVDSPSATSLKKIGMPLGPVEILNALRATSEVKCTKKKGEPCIPTQQVSYCFRVN
jgi:hypothetical protein